MRIVFAGSPTVAVPYLRALHEADCDIVAVITRTDSPVGRKKVVTPTAVATEAERLGLRVIKSNSLTSIDIPFVDVGVVVAYGGLVPRRLLSEPRHGWVNVHFSELPLYRGAAPVQRALWDGRDASGISIFRLVEELDAGPILFSKSIPFLPNENATEALARFAETTTADLVGTLRLLDAGAIVEQAQSGEPSFAPKFTREDGRVVWTGGSEKVHHRIRAVNTEPGAFTMLNGEPFGIVAIAPLRGDAPLLDPGVVHHSAEGVFVGTGDGSVELVVVKPFSKTAMPAGDWARGVRSTVTFS